MRTLLPEGWPRPKGYANGIDAEGRLVFVAGMIGWDETGAFPDKDFIGQVRRTLLSTLAVLKEGGAGPEHVARMTWYVTDKREYLAHVRELGAPVARAVRDPLSRHGGGAGERADRGRGEGRDRNHGGRPVGLLSFSLAEKEGPAHRSEAEVFAREIEGEPQRRRECGLTHHRRGSPSPSGVSLRLRLRHAGPSLSARERGPTPSAGTG